MLFFNKVDVYIGYSMEELAKVFLKREGIKYTYKVNDSLGQWLGNGTSRGNFGSFGMNKNYEKQYVVPANEAKKKDKPNTAGLDRTGMTFFSYHSSK